jgi:hypothetical protein
VIADAEPLIRDAGVAEEARLFRAQEGIHSLAHRLHLNALMRRYPGLKQVVDKAVANYDALYDAHDLKFHLAYVGGLEATFTPTFKLMLDNRDILFDGGDAHIASLFVWHFCEEVEHRASALAIYNHVFGDTFYRLRNFAAFYGHSAGCVKTIIKEFQPHVPEAPAEAFTVNPLKGTPIGQRMRALVGIVGSQMPWHDPEHAALPVCFGEWRTRYERGEDMRTAYGLMPADTAHRPLDAHAHT